MARPEGRGGQAKRQVLDLTLGIKAVFQRYLEVFQKKCKQNLSSILAVQAEQN